MKILIIFSLIIVSGSTAPLSKNDDEKDFCDYFNQLKRDARVINPNEQNRSILEVSPRQNRSDENSLLESQKKLQSARQSADGPTQPTIPIPGLEDVFILDYPLADDIHLMAKIKNCHESRTTSSNVVAQDQSAIKEAYEQLEFQSGDTVKGSDVKKSQFALLLAHNLDFS